MFDEWWGYTNTDTTCYRLGMVLAGSTVQEQPNAPTTLDNQFAQNDDEAHFFLISLDDDLMLDCFLNFPEVTWDDPFPVDFKTIQEEQNKRRTAPTFTTWADQICKASDVGQHKSHLLYHLT